MRPLPACHPEGWGKRGDRLPEFERVAEPVRLKWDSRAEAKAYHLMNQGYERDWRTGLWRHQDDPHVWFTLEVLMQLNPPAPPRKCPVCGYPTGFAQVCLCCD